jgi:predicted ester cyclase
MTQEQVQSLYRSWLEMWNGQLDLATQIVSPDCVVHHAPFGPGEQPEFRGPDGIEKMIRMGREPFDHLAFTCEVGPIIDGDQLAARWTGRGTYRGGIPGATAPAGTPITFSGIDIFRIEAGRITEYWVSSDGVHLMAQLGMLPARG